MDPCVITIDGPAASGKSTAARRLAERLGALYLDSGAMYRAATLAAIERGVDLGRVEALEQLVSSIDIRFEGPPTRQKVYLDGRDVSEDIRRLDVTAQVRHLAGASPIRRVMRNLQRRIADGQRLMVAEGRDMGSVVFGDSPCKFYLDASVEERARRRWLETKSRGSEIDLDKLCRDIVERDRTDLERADSPLVRQADATYIDTTGMTIEDVVAKMEGQVRRRLGL